MNLIQMIANLNLNEAREEYKELSIQLKFEYFLVYKHINSKLCCMKESENYLDFCNSWEKNWDQINEMLNNPFQKQGACIELYKKEFDEKLANQPELLIDYYLKLLIFSNIKQLQKKSVLTKPTKLFR